MKFWEKVVLGVAVVLAIVRKKLRKKKVADSVYRSFD